jgi:hypothetical protein
LGNYLLVDFGSTYTKIAAVDLEREEIIGWAQAPTTVDTDITIGLNNALSRLWDAYGIDVNRVQGKYACSSAAGGLRLRQSALFQN